MQTIHINKLEDLDKFGWEYKRWGFSLFGQHFGEYYLVLKEKKYMISSGEITEKNYRTFKLKNISELELYGLKVILNEKPRLTRKERDLLDAHAEDIYIARGRSGLMCIYDEEPKRDTNFETGQWILPDGVHYLALTDGIFDFISWESGKAWSKAELMELEVVE